MRSLRDHQVMSEAKKVMEEPVSEILSLNCASWLDSSFLFILPRGEDGHPAFIHDSVSYMSTKAGAAVLEAERKTDMG